MRMNPLKRRAGASPRVSAKGYRDSLLTVRALLSTSAVAVTMMDERQPSAVREARLYQYLRDLCRTLPLDTALAVGAAALDDDVAGCGTAFARWYTIRLTSKEPSLDDILNAVWDEDLEQDTRQTLG